VQERGETIEALQAKLERLKKAGDAFLSVYIHACAKGLVDEDTAHDVVGEWRDAKEGRDAGINVDSVRHILRRYCHRPYLKVRKHACASNARPGWGSETADPAILTPEQLDTARRVGITPERFAWLCSIPKENNPRPGAIGWRGGNTIG